MFLTFKVRLATLLTGAWVVGALAVTQNAATFWPITVLAVVAIWGGVYGIDWVAKATTAEQPIQPVLSWLSEQSRQRLRYVAILALSAFVLGLAQVIANLAR